jgi:hypothetical protein
MVNSRNVAISTLDPAYGIRCIAPDNCVAYNFEFVNPLQAVHELAQASD